MAEHGLTTSNLSVQQGFIAELSQIALESSSLEALLDLTVHRVREILKADFCEVLEYDPQTQLLLLHAGAGWDEGLVGKAQFEAGTEWQAGFSLFSDGPVVVDDLGQENRFHSSPLLFEQGIRSGISAVIKGYEHLYGVLAVHSQISSYFKQDDAQFQLSCVT
jgi:GAF domain-containing protein